VGEQQNNSSRRTRNEGRNMHQTAIVLDDIERIRRGPEAWELATEAYAALIEQLEALEPGEWERPTVCAPWTVADMVRHLVGAAESFASVREGIRQQVWANRHKREFNGSALDAWTGLHVRKHADLPPPALLARLREIAPRAVRGRSRFPQLLGGIAIPLDQTGSLPPGSPKRVTLGELNTVIYTRDAWLHRIDIARATGREPQLRPELDGRIVQDVAAEWAGRHGAPFRLMLGGPAGGNYTRGSGGPEIQLDAVEFAWILSGRGTPPPTLATPMCSWSPPATWRSPRPTRASPPRASSTACSARRRWCRCRATCRASPRWRCC
jgi:uncharacterized protein (TIGR03083 family)